MNPSTSSSEEWTCDNQHNREAVVLSIPREVIQGQCSGIILSLIEAFQKCVNGEGQELILQMLQQKG